jgi:hypothetical protein
MLPDFVFAEDKIFRFSQNSLNKQPTCSLSNELFDGLIKCFLFAVLHGLISRSQDSIFEHFLWRARNSFQFLRFFLLACIELDSGISLASLD